jgi:predicted TIM-barrel fold metal-dependent hydrolase
VQEYGVWNKLLFGSDYPFTTVNESIDGLRNLNSQLEGTALPRLNEEEIEKLIHRDGFEILGIS